MRTLLLAAAVALAGCAALEKPAEQPAPVLTAVPKAFEMSGRLSVRQGDRGDIAKLRWVHRPDADTWIVASPLGNEVARIESGNGGAQMRAPGQPVQQAASFAALTHKLVGVGLDPQWLSRWLHGESGASAAGGWAVTIDESQQAGAVKLARRITASRGDVVVKLVVDGYRVLED